MIHDRKWCRRPRWTAVAIESALAVFLLAAVTPAHGQCIGEVPSDSPCFPRVIPGAAGVYDVTMDLTNATVDYMPACGVKVGQQVWFEVTPVSSGTVTFTTCRPTTGFDTVVQVYRDGGDCEFPVRLDDLCVDDSVGAECTNACAPSPRASTVTFSASARVTYLIQVGAYNQNSAGCALCLGVRVRICGEDVTPPVVAINSPLDGGCYCGGDPIVGTAADADSGIDRWSLDVRGVGGFFWQNVSSGTTSVLNAALGNLGQFGFPEGPYHLRLTATNGCGASPAETILVYPDALFQTVDFASPAHLDVVGGTVCMRGTADDENCFDHYTVGYRPVGTGALSPVDSAWPTYTTPVVDSTLATWDTISRGVPDGDYELSVRGDSRCGAVSEVIKAVTVDNTPPTAIIELPDRCGYVEGVIDIFGTVVDANLDGWTLQYTGGHQPGWTTLETGLSNAVSALLGQWDTSLLPPCAYTLRLVAWDRATVNCQSGGHRVEYTTSVNVGFCGDFDVDDDGDVDLFDYSAFEQAFIGPRP